MERLIITYRKRQMGQPVTVVSRFLGEIGEDGRVQQDGYLLRGGSKSLFLRHFQDNCIHLKEESGRQ
jgi:hypothetical protein